MQSGLDTESEHAPVGRLSARNLPQLQPCIRPKWNLVSLILGAYVQSVLWTGFRRPLEFTDLTEQEEITKVKHLSKGPALQTQQQGIIEALCKRFWKDLVVLAAMNLLQLLPQVIQQLLIRQLLLSLSNPARTSSWWWAASLVALNIFSLLITGIKTSTGFVLATKARTLLTLQVYRKIFTMSNESRTANSEGSVINNISIDVPTSAMFIIQIQDVFILGITSIIAIILIASLLGWGAAFCTFVLLAGAICTTVIASQWIKIREATLEYTDKRLKASSDVLQAMKTVRLNVWDSFFEQKIKDLRKDEVRMVFKANVLKALLSTSISAVPILMSVGSFTIYALSGNQLTPSTVYSALSYFNLLMTQFHAAVTTIGHLVSSLASFRRLNSLFASSDYRERYSTLEVSPLSVNVEEASFMHPKMKPINLAARDDKYLAKDPESEPLTKQTFASPKFDPIMSLRSRQSGSVESTDLLPIISQPTTNEVAVLTNLSFTIEKGSLCCVTGLSGCGKSSLIQALLGQLDRLTGTVKLNTGYDPIIAYCAQHPWIENASLRENIILGGEFDEVKYKRVIDACGLDAFIETLPGGDQSELIENGRNLSGGQKMRVSLARAAYSNAEIVLLDDILSSLDATISNRIFSECILKLMRGRTVVMATQNQLHLQAAGNILVMRRGTIVESGTYDELLRKPASELANVLKNSKFNHEQTSSNLLDSGSSQTSSAALSSGNLPTDSGPVFLSSAEERNYGSVDVKHLLEFIRACGGFSVTAVLLMTYIGFNVLHAFNTLWLGSMSTDRYALSLFQYCFVYVLVAGLSLVVLLIRDISLAFVLTNGARNIHDKTVEAVMRAKMSFFDKTPSTRILSRLSRDVFVLDMELLQLWDDLLRTTFTVISSGLVIVFVTPFFIIPFFAILIAFSVLIVFYRSGMRDIVRLASLSLTALNSHVSTTYSNISSITAYRAEAYYQQDAEKLIDFDSSITMLNYDVLRWLSNSLRMLGIVTETVILLTVLADGSIPEDRIGVAIHYSSHIPLHMSDLVFSIASLETRFNSVERLVNYFAIKNENHSNRMPPVQWPSQGRVQFHDVHFKYRKHTSLILRQININTQPAEKIGIVGQSGAGKTSLVNVLLRLNEITSGRIEIDGIDINDVDVRELRSRIVHIPQQPRLLLGTIRDNIDPYHKYSDHQLWSALERAHLRHIVESFPMGLYEEVTDSNCGLLSAGQVQLLYFARAVLLRPKIVILDEATSSMDTDSEQMIDATLREEFSNSTLIIIAHRINTVLECDRIIVMDKGAIVDFDSPKALLEVPNSSFRKLVESSGLLEHARKTSQK